jgi:uncharacterized membrane protein
MMTKLRRYLVAGLLVWVPLGVTVLIINFLVGLADQSLLLLPASWRPEQLFGFRIPGLGFLLVLAVVLLTGIVVANLFGQQLIKLGETILARIPVVRSIYGSVKQLTESLFSGSGKSFRKVVLVRYPHATSWTLAFQTGEGSREIRDKTGREIVSVFVPTWWCRRNRSLRPSTPRRAPSDPRLPSHPISGYLHAQSRLRCRQRIADRPVRHAVRLGAPPP